MVIGRKARCAMCGDYFSRLEIARDASGMGIAVCASCRDVMQSREQPTEQAETVVDDKPHESRYRALVHIVPDGPSHSSDWECESCGARLRADDEVCERCYTRFK